MKNGRRRMAAIIKVEFNVKAGFKIDHCWFKMALHLWLEDSGIQWKHVLKPFKNNQLNIYQNLYGRFTKLAGTANRPRISNNSVPDGRRSGPWTVCRSDYGIITSINILSNCNCGSALAKCLEAWTTKINSSLKASSMPTLNANFYLNNEIQPIKPLLVNR